MKKEHTLELRIEKGEKVGKVCKLDREGKMVVGRSLRCDLSLNDPLLSRRHFMISTSGDQCELLDLESSNGVFINGQKVDRTFLAVGDAIRVGNHILLVQQSQPITESLEAEVPGSPLRRNYLETFPHFDVIIGFCCNCDRGITEREIKGLGAMRLAEQYYCAACIPNDPLVGRSLGKYHLLRRLGAGPTTVVYLGYEEESQQSWAIKVLRKEIFACAPQTASRFIATLLKDYALDNPYLVIPQEGGEIEGYYYLRCPYISGTDLRTHIDLQGLLSPTEAIEVFFQVANALSAIHRLGRLHRNVKPTNILLSRDHHTIKLSDWGMLEAIDSCWELPGLAEHQQSFSNFFYISPEEILRAETLSPASDIYSLGASIYHAVTGYPPFCAKDLDELLHLVRAGRIRPPCAISPDIPPELEKIILESMAHSPTQRYPDATQLLQTLGQLQNKIVHQITSSDKSASNKTGLWRRIQF